jgi:hypothetical protein
MAVLSYWLCSCGTQSNKQQIFSTQIKKDETSSIREKIIDYYLPDSPTNAIKLLAKIGKNVTPDPFEMGDQIFFKVKSSNIFKMESKTLNNVEGSVAKMLLSFDDFEIKILKEKSATLKGNSEQSFNTQNTILKLPQDESSSIKWSYSLHKGEEIQCSAKFNILEINGQQEKVLRVIETTFIEPAHKCFDITKYIYRKGKGLWNYKSLPCNGSEKASDVIEYKFQLAYHESEMDGLVDELE